MWQQGMSLFDERCGDMCEFIAELRFAFSTDRPGEGQHAKLHKGVLSAPMHTEQYASFLLRTNELERQTDLEAHRNHGICLVVAASRQSQTLH